MIAPFSRHRETAFRGKKSQCITDSSTSLDDDSEMIFENRFLSCSMSALECLVRFLLIQSAIENQQHQYTHLFALISAFAMRCRAAIVFIGASFVNRRSAASRARNSSPSTIAASVFFALTSMR